MQRFTLLFLASAAVALGQAPQPAPGTPAAPTLPVLPGQAPQPGQQPGQPAGPGAPSGLPGGNDAERGAEAAAIPMAPAAGPVDPEAMIEEDFLYPKLNGDDLAELYRKFTGRRVTVSPEASQAEFRFVQRGPLSNREATLLLKKAALLSGFVFVPDPNPGLENHDVLVLGSGQEKPAGTGTEVITDPADLPEDDRVVSYIMDLKVIKPDEVARVFTTIVGQLGPYGSITPIPNAGSVVITEKTSLIRRLIQIQQEIDVSSTISTRFIKVQYADVQELAETLNELLNTQQESERSTGVNRAGGNQAPVANNNGAPAGLPGGANPAAAVTPGGESSAAEQVPIQIVPDTRTNRIFAMGRPVDIVFIEGLIAEFDTKTDERNFLKRKLRFVTVSEFLDIAEPALMRAFSGGQGSTNGGAGSTGANFGGSTAGGNRSSNTRTTAFGGNTGGSFGGNTGSSFGGQSGGLGGQSGGGFSGGSTLQDPQISSAPEARLVGRTLLVADNITNSLVVQGPPASVEIITNLLDEIDVKADQVMISAVFGQLALGNEFEFGIDYVQHMAGEGDFAGRGGGGGFPAVPLTNGATFNPGNLASASGLALYGKFGNFNVILNALQSDSNFKVLSRPTIYTSNNRKGVISSGQRVAIPTSTFNSGANGSSTNIQYQNVYLTLEVIPLVNSEDEITLEISLINEELGQDRIIPSGGEDLEVPDILSRQVLTSVTVPNGSTIALGGLISSTLRDSVSGIPVLSSIPGIGKLFSSTSKQEDRSELMVFIQPQIVRDSATLYDAQLDMDRRYDVAADSREFANPPVLPEPAPEGTAQPASTTPAETAPKERRILGRPGSFRR